MTTLVRLVTFFDFPLQDGESTALYPSGATAARPSAPEAGQNYFDTTLGRPIWWNGAAWINAAGAVV